MLTLEDKTACVNALITNLFALPVCAILKIEESGKLLLKGEPIEYDLAVRLRESAKSMLNQVARKVVQEQILFMAINLGVHQAMNAEQVLFSKAAIWIQQEEQKLYELLAGQTE